MKGMMVIMACCLLGLSYCATANAATTDLLSEILARGKVSIATNSTNPTVSQLLAGGQRRADTKCSPNEYTAAEFTGFEVDVAKEVAKRMGIEACFVAPAWGEIISGHWADRWDVAFASISITTERMEALYFAQPYYSEPAAFYVHQQNTTFTQPADLSDKKIGACAGCIYEYYLEGILTLPGQQITSLVHNAEIIAYDIQRHSFDNLAVGDGVKLDAVFADIFFANQAIAGGTPIRQLGEPVLYTYIAPAIDKKQSRDQLMLLNKINTILRELHTDGTLADLAKKYFKLDIDIITPAQQFDIRTLQQYP